MRSGSTPKEAQVSRSVSPSLLGVPQRNRRVSWAYGTIQEAMVTAIRTRPWSTEDEIEAVLGCAGGSYSLRALLAQGVVVRQRMRRGARDLWCYALADTPALLTGDAYIDEMLRADRSLSPLERVDAQERIVQRWLATRTTKETTMTKRIAAFFVLCVLGLAPSARAQTNPCTPPLPVFSYVTANSEINAQFSDYAAALGGATAWTDVDISIVPKGANPASAVPVASVSVAKSVFTLNAGTTDCYHYKPSILFGVAPGVEYDAYMRTKRTTPDAATSPWSNAAPFGRFGPLAAPGIRITP